MRKVTNLFLILFILCTVLPVKLNYSSICIIILLGISALNYFTGKGVINSTKKKLFIIGIPLLIYVLGLLNSSNLDYGVKFISRNLSFIAFPFIFYSLSKWINKNSLFSFYLIGLAVVNMYLWYLFIYYFNFGQRFYMIVTTDIYHSTYLGMYNIFAYWVCVYYLIKSKKKFYILLSIFFVISAVMTSSRIIFILVMISLVASIFIIIKSRTKKISIALLIMITGLVLLAFVPSIRGKFHQIVEIDQIGFDKNNYGSISSRFGKIEASYQVVKKNLWFGTGTGDMLDELVKQYKEMKFTMGYKYRYNPHNQFLDNVVRNGLIGGGISLVVLYLFPICLSVQRRDLLLGSLILVVAGVSMTESMLDTHKGITFYVFFVTLLISNERNESK